MSACLPSLRLLLTVLGALALAPIIVAPCAAAADYFLHTTQADILDQTSPTATTAKLKDSPAVNRTTYQPIGTWSGAPTNQARQLDSVSAVHVWVGLKNSDDQGTYFDVRAEVRKNGVVVASGETKNIQGVTRNPDLAKEVVVALGLTSPVMFDAGDVLSLKLLAKVADSGGHANAVGLRAYYDGTSRASRFGATLTAAASLQIAITSPMDGGVLPEPATLVEGTLTGPPGTGVTLTITLTFQEQSFELPIPVQLAQGRFAAWVALTVGANRLVARATAPTGASAESAASVIVQADDPELTRVPRPDVSPTVGFAPLAVTFGGVAAAAPEVVVLDLDVDSDGVPDYTLAHFATPPHKVTHVYSTEGLYITTMVIRDATGQSRTTRVPINVIPVPDLGAIWRAFQAALVSGDIDAALQYVAVEARDRYRSAFLNLQSDLPSIAAAFQTLTVQVITSGYGTASLVRIRDGLSEGFLIHFVRDGDGVWRIASM